MINIISALFTPFFSRENIYRMAILTGLAFIYCIDYLAKMNLDTFGANLLPSFEKLGAYMNAEDTTPAPTLSHIMFMAHHSQPYDHIFHDIFWAAAETIFAQFIGFAVELTGETLRNHLFDSAKVSTRKRLLSSYLGPEHAYVMLDGIPNNEREEQSKKTPEQIILNDTSRFFTYIIHTSHYVISSLLNIGVATYKLAHYSSPGINVPLPSQSKSIFIPYYAAVATIGFCLVKAGVLYQKFWHEMRDIMKEYNNRYTGYVADLSAVHVNRRAINLTDMRQYELNQINEQQDALTKLNKSYYMLYFKNKMLGQILEQGMQGMAIFLAALAVSMRHIHYAEVPSFLFHSRNLYSFGQQGELTSWMLHVSESSERIEQFERQITIAQQLYQKKNIQFVWGEHFGFDFTLKHPNGEVLIKNLHCQFEKGTISLIRGPSGSGKSTIVGCMADAWAHGEGTITLPRGCARYIVPQDVYLRRGLTLFELMLLPQPAARSKENMTFEQNCQLDKVKSLMNKLGLEKFANDTDLLQPRKTSEWTNTLSGGEKKRIALIQALLKEPDIIILDELTAGLDEAAKEKVYNVIKEQANQGTTFIFIEHIPEEILAQKHDFFDKVINIQNQAFVENHSWKLQAEERWQASNSTSLKR